MSKVKLIHVKKALGEGDYYSKEDTGLANERG